MCNSHIVYASIASKSWQLRIYETDKVYKNHLNPIPNRSVNSKDDIHPLEGIPAMPVNLEINYHNISLEDSNNMWSNLGGEQKPYAMYQIKMMEIEADPIDEVDKDKALIEANISSPDYNNKGETIFIESVNSQDYGKPQNDTKEIKHQ